MAREKLREYRLSINKTQEEMAKIWGITLSFYSKISQRGSKMKAVIACAHKLLRIIYKILATHQEYDKEKVLGLRQQF